MTKSSLCCVLKSCSAYIYDWLNYRASNAVNMLPCEESITDWLIYEVCKNATASYVVTTRYTKLQESKITGADWEWVFIFDNGTYVFRIQAKKLECVNNYDKINYPKGTAQQITKLIADANLHNAFPVYVFYSCDVTICKCSVHQLNNGVFISDANQIDRDFVASGKSVIAKDDISKDSIPLPCLLCCNSNAVIDSTGSLFITQLKKQFKLQDDYIYKIRQQNIPNYIHDILTYKDQKFPAWYEEEYRKNLKRLDGILVFDCRSST